MSVCFLVRFGIYRTLKRNQGATFLTCINELRPNPPLIGGRFGMHEFACVIEIGNLFRRHQCPASPNHHLGLYPDARYSFRQRIQSQHLCCRF